MTKKERPAAICNKCRHCTDILALINQSCPIRYKKTGICNGKYRSMLHADDWKECTDCSTTGIINDISCDTCRGSGWICTRKNY